MSLETYGSSGAKGATRYITLGGFSKTGEKNPISVEGYYLGRSVGPNQFNPGTTKTTFYFNVNGEKVGVNGNWGLISAMDTAESNYENKHGSSPSGVMCLVTCDGMEKTKKGNTVKLFTVGFDSADVADVESLESSSSDDLEDEGYSGSTIASSQSRGANAAARVKELLNKNKSRSAKL